MKAKQIPRIDIHDRIELKNALPLRTPYVIYIDPSDTCNFRCKFCPSGNLDLMKKTKGRGHGPMDFQVYKGIIDQLKEFPDPVRVILRIWFGMRNNPRKCSGWTRQPTRPF